MKIGGRFRRICSITAHMKERPGHRRFGRLDIGPIFAVFAVGRSAPEASTHANLWLHMMPDMCGILHPSSAPVMPT